MNAINEYINSQLLNSISISNRNVVAAICINELTLLLNDTTDLKDRQILQTYIGSLKCQIDKEVI